jgi:hypothetical protein
MLVFVVVVVVVGWRRRVDRGGSLYGSSVGGSRAVVTLVVCKKEDAKVFLR